MAYLSARTLDHRLRRSGSKLAIAVGKVSLLYAIAIPLAFVRRSIVIAAHVINASLSIVPDRRTQAAL
jgi:uncharacterized membrane protein